MGLDTTLAFDQVMLTRFLTLLGGSRALLSGGMSDLAKTMHLKLQGATPYDKGDAKKAWTDPSSGWDGGAFIVRSTNPVQGEHGEYYANALEYGEPLGGRWGYGDGPRTTTATSPYTGETRVYSRQAPGGIYHEAFSDAELKAYADQIAQSLMEGFSR